MNKTLDDERIDHILATIKQMLREPTCRVSWSRGVRYWNNWDTRQVCADPTPGLTVTIEIHGGGREIRESAEDELARLCRAARAPL